MQKLLTSGLGLTASELVQQSNINDIAGAITQIIIAIVTLIGLFNKNHPKKMKRKIVIKLLQFLTIELSKQLVKIDKKNQTFKNLS